MDRFRGFLRGALRFVAAYLLIALVCGILMAVLRPSHPADEPAYVATKIILGALIWPVLVIGTVLMLIGRMRQ